MVIESKHLRLLALEAERAERYPIDYAARRLTQPQRDWLAVQARIAVWRGGNQLGKSWGMAVDLVLFARGAHPWQIQEPRHRPPVRIMVVSYSWEQMDPFVEKVWGLLPKHEIDPALSYQQGRGLLGHKEKLISFIDGPGKGSTIVFATYKQGSERIAGGSYHRIYMDEPPPEEIYAEVRPRLNRHRGHLRISFTPTLKSQQSTPVTYLREKIEAGPETEFAEQLTILTEDNTKIRGGLIEPALMPQSEIDAFIRDCLEIEVGMRVRGEWEPITVDRWLSTFGEHNLLAERPPAGCLLGVGIDHGLGAGNQTAVLMAVSQSGPNMLPTVWLWDEVAPVENTTLEDDARAIKAMLERNRLRYHDIDIWCGDTPTGKNKQGAAKTNQDLRHHIALVYSLRRRQTKYIDLPKDKSKGSEHRGLRLMKTLMATRRGEALPRFRCHPRCERFKQSVLNYNGGIWSPHKHIIDASRYIFEHLVEVGSWVHTRAIYA